MQLRRIQNPFKRLKTDFFVKKISSFQLLTSLAKSSTSDVSQGSEYASFQSTININKTCMAKASHRRTLRMGIKKSAKLQQEPFWKRDTESDIARLRKDLGRLNESFKGKWKKDL